MAPNKERDTSQMPVGQPADIILADGSINMGQPSIEPVDLSALNKSYLEELAFMDDFIEIFVQESTNPNDENPVPVGCNGVFVYLDRGKPVMLKRKFVNNLIVKSSRVSTPEYTNGAGERAFKIVQQNALKYPFMVLKDPSHKGGEWLARRMAELV